MLHLIGTHTAGSFPQKMRVCLSPRARGTVATTPLSCPASSNLPLSSVCSSSGQPVYSALGSSGPQSSGGHRDAPGSPALLASQVPSPKASSSTNTQKTHPPCPPAEGHWGKKVLTGTPAAPGASCRPMLCPMPGTGCCGGAQNVPRPSGPPAVGPQHRALSHPPRQIPWGRKRSLKQQGYLSGPSRFLQSASHAGTNLALQHPSGEQRRPAATLRQPRPRPKPGPRPARPPPPSARSHRRPRRREESRPPAAAWRPRSVPQFPQPAEGREAGSEGLPREDRRPGGSEGLAAGRRGPAARRAWKRDPSPSPSAPWRCRSGRSPSHPPPVACEGRRVPSPPGPDGAPASPGSRFPGQKLDFCFPLVLSRRGAGKRGPASPGDRGGSLAAVPGA